MIMKIEEAIEILKKDIYTDIPRSAIGARNHNTAVPDILIRNRITEETRADMSQMNP